MQQSIHQDVEFLKEESERIKKDVERIKDKLIDHTPEHFSKQDFIRAFIGALFLGFSILFSGNLLEIAMKIPEAHFYIMILVTLIFLTIGIYIIGYKRVVDKNHRKFGQFWLKRLSAFYLIGLIVATGLTFLFGIQYLVPSTVYVARIIIIMSVPCAIGASLADLLKKY